MDFLFPKDPILRWIEEVVLGQHTQHTSSTIDELINFLPPAPPPPPEYPWIDACCAYKHPLTERLVWALKYERSDAAATIMAHAMLRHIEKQGTKSDESTQSTKSAEIKRHIYIVPIPSSRRRRRERGYDHIGLIAAALTTIPHDKNEIEVLHLLQKHRHTRAQNKLPSREARLFNLHNAFSLTQQGEAMLKKDEIDEIIAATIILIDDVCTTGSTLAAARNTLVAHNVQNVRALTFAR